MLIIIKTGRFHLKLTLSSIVMSALIAAVLNHPTILSIA